MSPKRAKAEPVKNVPIEEEKKKHKTNSKTTSVPLTPSAIEEPSTHVSLEALLAQVSPIKNRRFVGELVDEKSSIQLVGFDPVSQAKLEELSQQKLPILRDVQFTKKLVKRYTKIDVSIGAKYWSISLDELRSMQESRSYIYRRLNM